MGTGPATGSDLPSSELAPGARNAIRTCLNVRPGERVAVVTDRETAEIAAALVREIEAVGAEYCLLVLEDLAERPLRELPRRVGEELERSQVSIFAAQAQPGELSARLAMTSLATKLRVRHGHMINVNRRVMLEGMRADFRLVDRLGTWVIERTSHAEQIRVTSPAGTDIVAEFSPDLRWWKTSGLISPDKWGNLPGGEVFTSPATVNGRYVVDGVVGDYLCAKYGSLRETPLAIEIVNGRVADFACENEDLIKDFWQYICVDENSNRVGEFAIGINLAVHEICGNILQDEKIPGIHLAFGDPYPEHTKQTWSSTTHLDCVTLAPDIVVNDLPIMREGEFLWRDRLSAE